MSRTTTTTFTVPEGKRRVSVYVIPLKPGLHRNLDGSVAKDHPSDSAAVRPSKIRRTENGPVAVAVAPEQAIPADSGAGSASAGPVAVAVAPEQAIPADSGAGSASAGPVSPDTEQIDSDLRFARLLDANPRLDLLREARPRNLVDTDRVLIQGKRNVNPTQLVGEEAETFVADKMLCNFTYGDLRKVGNGLAPGDLPLARQALREDAMMSGDVKPQAAPRDRFWRRRRDAKCIQNPTQGGAGGCGGP